MDQDFECQTKKMEVARQNEIEELSLAHPSPGSMQIAGRNGFGHNIDYMPQVYLRNRSCSQIDIELEDTSNAIKDRPLPIFLKVVYLFSLQSSLVECLLPYLYFPFFGLTDLL